jgi:hypothetical protein
MGQQQSVQLERARKTGVLVLEDMGLTAVPPAVWPLHEHLRSVSLAHNRLRSLCAQPPPPPNTHMHTHTHVDVRTPQGDAVSVALTRAGAGRCRWGACVRCGRSRLRTTG